MRLIKYAGVMLVAALVFGPAVQAEEEPAAETEAKLPRVFNYNNNVQLFRVDPHVNIPDNKNSHLQKYDQGPERNSSGGISPLPNLPSSFAPPTRPNLPEKNDDKDKSKNWLTPSDWNTPEDYTPEEANRFGPSPEEDLEAIRQLFEPENASGDMQEKGSFLSYIQKQQDMDEQEKNGEEARDESGTPGRQEDEEALFQRERRAPLSFDPSLSALSTRDGKDDETGDQLNESRYEPALEILNFQEKKQEALDEEATVKPIQSMAEFSNRGSMLEAPASRSQAMLNEITSKWLNKQTALSSMPKMSDQLNVPGANPTANWKGQPDAPSLPPAQKSFSKFSPAPALANPPYAGSVPSLGRDNSLNQPSFSASPASLAQPSSQGRSGFNYQPRRISDAKQVSTPSLFAKPVDPSSGLPQPDRMSSGLSNKLPGMSGFSDPMR